MEWQRSCEEVRRFAPNVGRLGQWKAFCDGGWVSSIPENLPDPEAVQNPSAQENNPRDQPPRTVQPVLEEAQETDDVRSISQTQLKLPESQEVAVQRSTTTSRAPSAYNQPRGVEPLSGPGSPLNPPRPLVDDRMDSVASITTLTSFPSPPTHFPIPPQFSKLHPPQQASGLSAGDSSSASHSPLLESGQRTASPLPVSDDGRDAHEGLSVQGGSREDLQSKDSRSQGGSSSVGEDDQPGALREIQPMGASSRSNMNVYSPSSSVQNYRPGDYFSDDGHEFGVRRNGDRLVQSVDALRSRGVQRHESVVSNGSAVTSLRNHYTTTVGLLTTPENLFC